MHEGPDGPARGAADPARMPPSAATATPEAASAPEPGEPVILLRDFELVRDGRALVRGESWELKPGERVLLTGPSGSGKSSFLLALAGLAPEHAPGLTLRGGREGRPSTGVVFQNPYAQLACPSVDDELAFALENAGWELNAMRARVAELKARFGLIALGDRAPWTLSGGEAQRVALASALAAGPKLMLLDEPLGYLDGEAALGLVELATKAGREAAWVVVDHDPTAWAAWADTHYRLGPDGHLIKEPIPQAARRGVKPAALTPGSHASVAGAPLSASSVTATPLLEIRGLSAGYGRGPDVLAGFSLSLGPGETVAVVGPSGSGKSTVFRCLTGQLKPRAGSFFVDGAPYTPNKRRASPFAWVPQVPEHYFVYDSARAEWENGAASGAGASDSALRARAFGLEALAERHPFTLSEGEKRRLNLASAIAMKRRILLLDEPQFGLDGASQDALEESLARLRAEGVSMLIISHDPAFCDRVAHHVVRIGRPAAAAGEPGGATSESANAPRAQAPEGAAP
jgi:energy-coupling factor transport system ATP-binding protein